MSGSRPCRAGVLAMVLGAVVGALPASAQPAGSHRVGILVPQALPGGWEGTAFREAMRDLGYREGVNLFLDVLSGEGRLERLPALAAELVGRAPQVILALNTPGTRAVMEATRTIPIVMAEVGDPVATGFVRNLARPEGNVTGASNLCGELGAKRLSLLVEAIPAARRVAVLLNPGDPITTPQVKDVERAAPGLGIEVRMFPVRGVPALEATLERVRAWRADAALWLCGQQGALELRSVALAPAQRLPVMPYRSLVVRSGGLISYAPNRADLMRRAAVYVDKLLKGAKPADLPVDQPTQLELFVNLKTARALGLTVPPALLLRADEVIQ